MLCLHLHCCKCRSPSGFRKGAMDMKGKRIAAMTVTLLLSLSMFSCTKKPFTTAVLEEDNFQRVDQNVVEARLKTVNDVTRLFIDGKAVTPNMFSYIHNMADKAPVLSQLSRADKYGTNIVRIIVSITGSTKDKIEPYVKPAIDEVLSQNPDAYILLTYGVYVNPFTTDGDYRSEAFKNQRGELQSFCSLASEYWLNQFVEGTKGLVEYILSDPVYSNRVIGYQPCAGAAGEWLGPMYWEGMIDCSEANTNGFRKFLQKKYKTDLALKEAWGNGAVRFDNVEIPDRIPGSGTDEIRNPLDETLIMTPENQIFTDYEDYYSGMVADAILTLAKTIKTATDGRSLTAAYSGYHSEVRTPFAGNFGLYKLLKSEDIDILTGPVSYSDRNEGGIGAYMSPVSSINASGKLWLDECDYRTSYRTSTGAKPGGTQESVNYMENIQSDEATIEVLRREIGKSMVYGTGYYWLDLIYRGWFDSDNFWKNAQELNELYYDYMKMKQGTSPEVAFVYDELAFNMLGQPWQISTDLIGSSKDLFYTAGYSFGYYSIDDVIAGKTDEAKIIYMMTPWRMSQEQIVGLKKKLFQSKKTVVWMYGYGQTDQKSFSELIGMELEASNKQGLTDFMFENEQPKGLEALKSLFYINRDLSPWYRVKEQKDLTVLARYDGSQNIAVAINEKNGYRSVFYGSAAINEKVYSALNELSGANCFLDSKDVVYADSSLVVIHTKQKGEKTIRFPKKTDVYDYFEGKWYRSIRELKVDAGLNQTKYYFYGNQKDLMQCGIGAEK